MISGTFLILSAITFAACYCLIIKKKQEWKNCPPGPTRLPFVGNILQLGQPKVMYKTYYKWAEKYGKDIFRVDLANKKTVVISDHKLLKQVFSEPNFSGRMELKLYDVVTDSHVEHGIALTDGKHWEELRRFSIKQLKDFGFTKMEDSIMMEVNELLDILKQEENKPISNIRDKLLIAVVNSVWAIISGKRYSQNDKVLLRMTENTFKATEKSSILVLLPFLKDIIPEYSGYNIMRKAIKTFTDFFEDSIDEHKKSFDETHNRDFIDSFISEIRKTENKESAFYGKLGEENLVAVMNDLWFAGTDTSSSSLGWLILCLSKNPEIQENMQREITAITGNSRSVSVTD